MKLSDVKTQIDDYFKNISPEAIIDQFEKLGYIFVDAPTVIEVSQPTQGLSPYNYDTIIVHTTKVSVPTISYDYSQNNSYSIAA